MFNNIVYKHHCNKHVKADIIIHFIQPLNKALAELKLKCPEMLAY